MAFLARQEALGLCGALLAWSVVATLLAKRKATGRMLVAAVVAASCFLVAAMPFFVFAKRVTGHVTFGPHLSHNVVVREAFKKVYFRDNWVPFLRLYLSLDATRGNYDNAYYGVVGDIARSEREDHSDIAVFARLARGIEPSAVKYWLVDMTRTFPWYFLPLVAIPFVRKPSVRWAVDAGFLAAALAPALFIATALLVLPRYNVYVSGILGISAAAGLAALARSVQRSGEIRTGRVVLCCSAVIAIAGAAQALAFNYRAETSEHREYHIMKLTPPLAAAFQRLAPPRHARDMS